MKHTITIEHVHANGQPIRVRFQGNYTVANNANGAVNVTVPISIIVDDENEYQFKIVYNYRLDHEDQIHNPTPEIIDAIPDNVYLDDVTIYSTPFYTPINMLQKHGFQFFDPETHEPKKYIDIFTNKISYPQMVRELAVIIWETTPDIFMNTYRDIAVLMIAHTARFNMQP